MKSLRSQFSVTSRLEPKTLTKGCRLSSCSNEMSREDQRMSGFDKDDVLDTVFLSCFRDFMSP